MAAYIVAQVKVRDPAAYQRYREAVTPLVDRFGAAFACAAASSTCWRATGHGPAS